MDRRPLSFKARVWFFRSTRSLRYFWRYALLSGTFENSDVIELTESWREIHGIEAHLLDFCRGDKSLFGNRQYNKDVKFSLFLNQIFTCTNWKRILP